MHQGLLRFMCGYMLLQEPFFGFSLESRLRCMRADFRASGGLGV